MEIVNFIVHLDTNIIEIIKLFGSFTYAILFLIIFAETGLVVTPFLPGDSLLFVAGALAGGGLLSISALYLTLLVATILGDTVNYWLGQKFGARVFRRENSKLFNKAYLEKTSEFYAKYGGKTIVIARFVPIVRTFAPFVAGVGKMHYNTFLFYNVIGAFVWVTSLVFAGYFFGGLPFIKNNFEKAIFAVIFISLIPVIFELVKHRFVKEKPSKATNIKDIEKTFKKEHISD